MATDDIQRLVTGSAPAPATFKVPGNGQIRPKTIYAAFDGTNAGGAFKPALKITSDAGELVGIYPTNVSVAAGASAVVSWFPRLAAAAAAAASGIQFDVDNVGNWLEVETTGQVASAFSQPYAARHPATDYGQAFNADNGTLLTVPPDSFFNTGNAASTIEDYKASGDFGAFGQLIEVQDNTAAGTSSVTGEQIIAGADGTQDVTGEVVASNMGAAGTADALGITAEATNQGSGREIAVTGVAGAHKSGANALCFQGVDGSGNPTFEVYANGNIHIKTGATVTADL